MYAKSALPGGMDAFACLIIGYYLSVGDYVTAIAVYASIHQVRGWYEQQKQTN